MSLARMLHVKEMKGGTHEKFYDKGLGRYCCCWLCVFLCMGWPHPGLREQEQQEDQYQHGFGRRTPAATTHRSQNGSEDCRLQENAWSVQQDRGPDEGQGYRGKRFLETEEFDYSGTKAEKRIREGDIPLLHPESLDKVGTFYSYCHRQDK